MTRQIPLIPTNELVKKDGRSKVINDIHQERNRQEQLHPTELELSLQYIVLNEEVGEVAQALQSHYGLPSTKLTDKHDLYKELIEVAAVAVRMAEQVILFEKSEGV